jgi:hypothetical protein
VLWAPHKSWLWAPAAAARIGEPTRTIEVACFLRYRLMVSTDHLLWCERSPDLMVGWSRSVVAIDEQDFGAIAKVGVFCAADGPAAR